MESCRGKIITLLTSIVFVCVSNAQNTPSIGFISPDVITEIGGTAELTCRIQNENPEMKYPVMWMRLENGKNSAPMPISSGDELLLSSDRRFKLVVDEDESSYTITITDIRKADAGKYQCQVLISSDGSIAEDVEVKIKLQPVITKGSLGPSKKVQEDGSVELACDATGFPIPKITWTRKDGSLLPNGKSSYASSRMLIQKVRREDRGMYVCTADNEVGKPQNKKTYLDVEFSPKIKVPSPRIPQALYHEATLSCEIEAAPSPVVYWKKNNKTINNDGTFHISHFALADEKTITQLRVLANTKEEFGRYACSATNRLGDATQDMELYKSKLPIMQPMDLSAGFTTKSLPLCSIVCLLTTILFL